MICVRSLALLEKSDYLPLCLNEDIHWMLPLQFHPPPSPLPIISFNFFLQRFNTSHPALVAPRSLKLRVSIFIARDHGAVWLFCACVVSCVLLRFSLLPILDCAVNVLMDLFQALSPGLNIFLLLLNKVFLMHLACPILIVYHQFSAHLAQGESLFQV